MTTYTTDPIAFIREIVENAFCHLTGVEWHEKAIREAHNKLALAKIMLARGNYTEIDLAEVEAEAVKRLTPEEKDTKC